MKYFIVFLLFLTACGGASEETGNGNGNPQNIQNPNNDGQESAADCSNVPIVGDWSKFAPGGSALLFSNDCTGSTGTCAMQFTYSADGNNLTLDVSFIDADQPCFVMSTGKHSCTFAYPITLVGYPDVEMSIDCGEGVFYYARGG